MPFHVEVNEIILFGGEKRDMDVITTIRSAVSALARRTADQRHREQQFTMMLCAELWPHLGERLLAWTGLDWKTLIKRIEGTEADRIRQDHLPDTKDFYADLIVTDPPKDVHLKSTLRIDHVLEQMPISCIYEFKYLTSFPSLSRKIAREDTYKLKVLGEYVGRFIGRKPHMEQFIIASRRSQAGKRIRTVETLNSWFQDAEFRTVTSEVVITIVDVDGNLSVTRGSNQPVQPTLACGN